jgi:FtsP/CotA-like multicopper oxidase with cupredoxin domain
MSYRSTVVGGVALVVAGSLPFVAIARSQSDRPTATSHAASHSAAPSSTAAKVSLGEMFVKSAATLQPGHIHFTASNDGNVPHALAVDGTDAKTAELKPGETGALEVEGAKAGDKITVYCPIPGHREAGMVKTFTVAGHDGMDMGGSNGTIDFNAMDKAMHDRTAAFPAKTEGVGAQDLAPTVLPDGTKRFALTAAITPWEVEAGKVVQAWTYNGTVPGPTIKVDVGDKVEVVVTNKLPESTAVHFHGIRLPNSQDGVPDITQDPIKPGGTFTYHFTATRVAVGMYHSHHNAVTQVPNGLAGTFLIGEMPLPKGVRVTQELPMMLDDSGVIGFALNGKSFPATAPIAARRNEWIEVHYLNEGAMAHPMHLHGLDQLVIAKDGYALPEPYRADTVLVGPGERYTVLVKADVPGVWAWHCHILSHAENEQGMFGMVTAMVVK